MARILTQERRSEIATRLVREGRVSAAELARRYAVSTETIRRDLLWLEARGLAEKGYGGAIATAQAMEATFFEKATDSPEEKKRIARAVSQLIPPGATVLLDSGSTVLEVARLLAVRTALTLFTNSLEAARLLAEKKRAVCMRGGQSRLSSHAATGVWAVDMLSQLNAQVAVLGASGFSPDGPCVESMEECQVKRAMLRAADTVILAADSKKSRRRAAMRFAHWRDIALLVTDSGIDAQALSRIGQQVKAITA